MNTPALLWTALTHILPHTVSELPSPHSAGASELRKYEFPTRRLKTPEYRLCNYCRDLSLGSSWPSFLNIHSSPDEWGCRQLFRLPGRTEYNVKTSLILHLVKSHNLASRCVHVCGCLIDSQVRQFLLNA